jgi:hypothetical protein
MIKQFSKKGYKEIKRLLEKLEKKKVSLHEQEDLLILEKERNCDNPPEKILYYRLNQSSLVIKR